jgi:hypothetical protein
MTRITDLLDRALLIAGTGIVIPVNGGMYMP